MTSRHGRCIMEGSTAQDPMTVQERTQFALIDLAKALNAWPDDAKTLNVYGDMATHLADLISDLDLEGETDPADD